MFVKQFIFTLLLNNYCSITLSLEAVIRIFCSAHSGFTKDNGWWKNTRLCLFIHFLVYTSCTLIISQQFLLMNVLLLLLLLLLCEAEPPLLVLQGAPSLRVRQRPVQRSLSTAQAHHRALPSPSNAGTVPTSPRLLAGGRRGGGGARLGSEPEGRGGQPGPVPAHHHQHRRQARSSEGEPGGEEETGEGPAERTEAGTEWDSLKTKKLYYRRVYLV